MPLITSIPRPIRSVIGNIAIAAFLSLFVIANAKAWHATGDLSYLLVSGNESLFVLLYLIRQRPRGTSASPFDWSIGFSGSFIGTLLRPALQLAPLAGTTLVVVGTALNCAAVLSLNRSIGTVAAERTVKTGGLYRWVRHPMYATEICVLVGYLLGNASPWNAAIVAANIALLAMRMDREEAYLSRNPAYRAYIARTRWRLLPGIY